MPAQTDTDPPFQVLLLKADGGNLALVVGKRLRDRAWAERFGEVQEKLAQPAGRELTLDFRQTSWADPNPLLGLAITVEQWRQAGGRVVIALADPSADANHDPDLADFLMFLERDGFLALFAGVRPGPDEVMARGTKIRLGGDDVDDLAALRSRLFSRSQTLPIPVVPAIHAHLFDMREMKDDEAVSKLADNLIDEAESGGLKRHFDHDVYSDPTTSASALGARELSPAVFVEDLRQILIELLENVREHAYDAADPTHLVAVYARFRLGLQDLRAGHLWRNLIKLHQAESQDCPRIEDAAKVAQGGFMELFVADAGIGLSTHLARVLPHRRRPGERMHPLKAFFERLALGKGFSIHGGRAERERGHRSPLPGLQHVTTLLSGGHGLFRALDKLEWAGAECPLPLPEPGSGAKRDSKISESVSSNYPVRGTHILIRASTREPKSLHSPWAAAVLSSGAAAAADSTLGAWTDRASAGDSWRRVEFQVIDEEQTRWRVVDGEQRRVLRFGGTGNPYSCVLWRPARSLRRNDIRISLQRIGRDGIAHVIIADQDIATALMTASTLKGMALEGVPQLQRVSVVSYTLVAVDLVAYRTGSGTRLRPVRSAVLSTPPGTGLSLPHVISALRHLDGTLFWAAVQRHDAEWHLILPGPIRWSRTRPSDQEFNLDVHLDFTQVLNVKLCRWVCRRALSRFLSYCSPGEAPAPVDHLIDPLVNSFLYSNNTDYYPRRRGVRPSVLLGSVLMSWSSLRRRRSLAEVGERHPNPIIAHLLQHPRLPAVKAAGEVALSLISWVNGSTSLAASALRSPAAGNELKRITDTPVVGPGGTRYWRAYRCENGGSLYGVSPDRPQGVSVGESYGFWQSRGLLRLGHWHHGSNHDFVGIDLLTAIRGGRVNLRGMVWTFLRGHLQRLADGYQGSAAFNRCHLLACVPNEGTNLILNRAFEELPWLQAKTVYLPLVQRQRSAMRLRLSPIALEAARERIQTERRLAGGPVHIRVLLLDTNFREARTFIELINTIREIGADEVNTLALLDRTRLPTDIISFRRGWHRRHARLWRFDVDSLSPSPGPWSSAGCPLCEALEMVTNTRDKVPERMQITRRRLAEWIEIMRVRTLSKASPLAGLPAVKLPRPIPVGFGHDIEVAGEGRVQVFEAAALASILLEAVTITGMHEKVRLTLEEIKRTAASPSDGASEASLLAARLYVLIGQALLMRHDTELDRRVIIYRALLDALFDSSQPAPATAFGALVLATADDTILRSLAPDIEKHLAAPGRPEFDLALALGMMASRQDQLRRMPAIAAFLSMLGGARDDAPKMLREIFLNVGSRDGMAHAASLHRALEAPRSASSIQSVLSVVELLIDYLKRLKAMEAWIPRNGTKNQIATWTRLLSLSSQALRETHGNSEQAWAQLRLVVYGADASDGGIYRQILESFSVNVGQIEPLLMEILQRNGRAGSAAREVIEREGERNFEDKVVGKVRALRLLPIEDCIFELFDNALRHEVAPFPETAATVRWSCSVVGQAIEIEIRNLCEEHAATGRPSLSQSILEYLGGKVTTELRKGAQGPEFVSRVRLPTLLGLAAAQ